MKDLKNCFKSSDFFVYSPFINSLDRYTPYSTLIGNGVKIVFFFLLLFIFPNMSSAQCFTTWDEANEPFVFGDQVSRDNVNYTAKWWTTDNPPSASWTTNGPCGSAPTLTTTGATNEGCTTMDLVGNISDDGDPDATEKGFLYGTSSAAVDAATQATPGGATLITIASGGTGDFTSSLTGLTSSTTYYFKAYALNGTGTSYGVRTSGTTTAPCLAPTVTTTGSSSVECAGATMEGNVTVHGNSPVTKGFIYHTSNAVVAAATIGTLGGASQVDHATVATSTGAFTYAATGLSNSTTYYYKSHATNTTGSAYGTVLTFTTGAGCSAPTLAATVAASEVICTTANPGGNVTADGGATITERGLCYGTSVNPTTGDSKVTDGGTTGSWTGSLTGLSEGTTYYVRAYAINSEGTSYGSQSSFTTLTCPAVTYYTVSDGPWTTASNWNCDCVPSLSFTGNTFRVYHDMTHTGTLSGINGAGASYIMPGGSITTTAGLTINTNGGSDITMYSGASLNIGTTFSLAGSAGNDFLTAGDITATTLSLTGAADVNTTGGIYNFGDVDLISEGELNLVNSTMAVTNDVDIAASAGMTATGTPVSIGGDYNNGGDVDATFDQALTIGGDIVNNGSSKIIINGFATVAGNVTGTGNGDYTVNGFLDVTGSITLNTDADLDGVGVVAFGSADIDGVGTSYMICVGNVLRDTKVGNDPGVPTPANPIDLTSCGAGVLSASLLKFTAEKSGEAVKLNWVTGTETNNDYFSVLSSEDGVIWDEIGVVQGAGNSSTVRNYKAQDDNLEGLKQKYYRLKLVDLSGAVQYSNIRVVKFDGKGKIISFYDNGSYLNVTHDIVSTSMVVSLYDCKGDLVHIQSGYGSEGEVSSILIPSHDLVSGIYFMSINAENNVYGAKVIINKLSVQ